MQPAENRRSTTYARIVDHLRQCGARGATCDEVEAALALAHQTASARINELRHRGDILRTLERRSTRSGRSAVVYVV